MFPFQEREIPFCFQNRNPQQNRILKISFQNKSIQFLKNKNYF
ncbi:hypothetical protein LBBP_02535 [Leptospira borgpetersenii serovar Ballum]|uniref:Uncharacterized protein n=1 Tax=Leptospira borgpetersenii serovar Ballum TaxID=280505 RepID=A0A0S2ISY2_LEPBO|nr:hypothetical protein LBBP_02535 [Leptospira borgpetersenii serovar Ballum]